ncbi:cell division protein FtsQ/DivIB [Bacteroidota bacterium]
MNKRTKIFGLTFFLAVSLLIVYLSVTVENKKGYNINVIEIGGNIHLANDIYFKFANLNDRSTYGSLSLQIVKDRIEKHPYVKKTDVRYEGNGKVTVQIVEKNFQAVLYVKNDQYLVTESMEVLPILSYTKNLDYPVISNPVLNKEISMINNVRDNKDIVIAYKILSALELINPELYDSLSEIDLRNGKDIVLFFSLVGYPVWVGRDNEIEKVIGFNSLWSLLRGKDINNYLDYIDLRFSNHVYLGFAADRLDKGEFRS